MQDEEAEAQWTSEVTSYGLIANHSPVLRDMTPRLLVSGCLPPDSLLVSVARAAEPSRSGLTVPSVGTEKFGANHDESFDGVHPTLPANGVHTRPSSMVSFENGLLGTAPVRGPAEANVPEDKGGSRGMGGESEVCGKRFLVATRLKGVSWSDVEHSLSLDDRLLLARQLGRALAHVHSLPCPLPPQTGTAKQAPATISQASNFPHAPSQPPENPVNQHSEPLQPTCVPKEIQPSSSMLDGGESSAQQPANLHDISAATQQEVQPCRCAEQSLPYHDAATSVCQTLGHLQLQRDGNSPSHPAAHCCLRPGPGKDTSITEQQQQQPCNSDGACANSLDAAWQPLWQHLEEKLQALHIRLAEPEGPDGLQGIFPAHLWRQLQHELPASADMLLSTGMVPRSSGAHTISGFETSLQQPSIDDSQHGRGKSMRQAPSHLQDIGMPIAADRPEQDHSDRMDGTPSATNPMSTLDSRSRQESPELAATAGSHAGQPDGQSHHTAEQHGQRCSSASQMASGMRKWMPVWLHNDLSCFNVLLRREGPTQALSAIELLDFGDAMPGHPLIDFVVLHVRGFRCLPIILPLRRFM